MSQDDREDINAVNNKVDQGKATGFRTNIAHGVFRISPILFPYELKGVSAILPLR